MREHNLLFDDNDESFGPQGERRQQPHLDLLWKEKKSQSMVFCRTVEDGEHVIHGSEKIKSLMIPPYMIWIGTLHLKLNAIIVVWPASL